MVSIDPERNGEREIASFRTAMISWFVSNGRSYPWRETQDPYAILVSELMLQQTRVTTVLERGYFQKWMKAFPDWHSLAAAEETDVLKKWEGLGYYNRARNLHKTARRITREFGGCFPDSLDVILDLPGVGRYTAGAVMSFAFGKRAPIVDGNVVRVLARVTGFSNPVDTQSAMKQLWNLADQLTPSARVREFNSGVMELGQRVCLRSNPRCGECPLKKQCHAHADGMEGSLPRKSRRKEVSSVVEHVLVRIREGKVLLVCESGSRRKGLWRLPELESATAADLSEIFRFPYAITRYKVDLRVYRTGEGAPLPGELAEESGRSAWFSLGQPEEWPALGAPYRKAILKFLEISGDLVGS